MNNINFENCLTICSQPKIVVSENNMKFRILNNNSRKVLKLIVDGCLINDDRERCDFIFEIDEPCCSVVYLELKGCDIDKAYNQLISTMTHFKLRHCKVERKNCYIVASRVPKAGPKVQTLKAKMAKSFNAQLQVFTIEGEITV